MLRGEIWHINLGKPFGSEQGYDRPCLIVQCNEGNEHSQTVTICPLTTKVKEYRATHVEVNCLNIKSWIMCEQIRTVDKSRLKRKKGVLDAQTMLEVEEKLKIHLNL